MSLIPNLNRQIQIQSQTTTQDEYGQPQATWNTIYTCWANIDIQQSQLIYSTAEFVDKVTHRITVRWTPSPVFNAGMQIVFTEPYTGVVHTYEIMTVLNPQQSNFWMTFICYELRAQE
jgi:SPP1 family predicted phage head-tail adaptor